MGLSYAEIEGYWIAAGGNKAISPLMAAIAMAESSGDPNAKNATDNNGTQTSWGLWQISDGTHNQVSPTWNDPLTNAKLAVQKYNSQGLGAWGTYTSGAYKKYMQSGTVPQNPSPVAGTVQQTGVTSDVGGAIADGILKGFAGALGPVMKWAMWFAETAFGFVVMGIGLYLMAQSSETVRQGEKMGLEMIPARRVASPTMRATVPAAKAPSVKPPKDVNPYTGHKTGSPEADRNRKLKLQQAAAKRRAERAREKAAQDAMKKGRENA